MAKLGPKDMDVAVVHDCFTIAEICATEALGFFEMGQGGKAAEAGKTRLDGEMPINPSGGLKAKGHPVGATGVAQIHEIVGQLRGNPPELEGRPRHRGAGPCLSPVARALTG